MEKATEATSQKISKSEDILTTKQQAGRREGEKNKNKGRETEPSLYFLIICFSNVIFDISSKKLLYYLINRNRLKFVLKKFTKGEKKNMRVKITEESESLMNRMSIPKKRSKNDQMDDLKRASQNSQYIAEKLRRRRKMG